MWVLIANSPLVDYIYDIYLFCANFAQTWICVLICSQGRKKRAYFILRVALCVAAGLALCLPLAVLNSLLDGAPGVAVRVLCFLTVSAMAFAGLAVCYAEKPTELLFCWCSGVACQQISTRFYQLVQNFCGINDRMNLGFFQNVPLWYDWCIYVAYYVVFYAAFILFFRKRERLESDRQTAISVASLSVITVLVVNGLVCVARLYEHESMALNMILKIFCIMTGVLILFMCNGILSQSKTRRDMNILRHMWRQEQLQFEHAKASIEVINSKCHDLKHMFSRLENKLNDTEIAELKDAVEFYDRNIKTGNEILDVILCEKSMVCARDGIRLTCMADGGLVSFLSPAQTYSLFGNMITNAIEAVQNLSEDKKRVISLTVSRLGGGVEIECVNYCSPSADVSSTSKAERDKHGYGIKNMRYIVEHLGGELSISQSGGVFTLKIIFPVVPAASK